MIRASSQGEALLAPPGHPRGHQQSSSPAATGWPGSTWCGPHAPLPGQGGAPRHLCPAGLCPVQGSSSTPTVPSLLVSRALPAPHPQGTDSWGANGSLGLRGCVWTQDYRSGHTPFVPSSCTHKLKRGPQEALWPRLGHAPLPLWPRTTMTPKPYFLTWGHLYFCVVHFPHRTTRGGHDSGSTPTGRLLTSLPTSMFTGCALAAWDQWWAFTPWKRTNAPIRCPHPRASC